MRKKKTHINYLKEDKKNENQNKRAEIKVLPLKEILERLSIELAPVELYNEIKQIIYSLYQAK